MRLNQLTSIITNIRSKALEIRSTTKKNWNKRLTKHLVNLKKTLVKTSGYFTVASCPPTPRPRAHAPHKQGGKPADQDTSSYTGYSSWCSKRLIELGREKKPHAAKKEVKEERIRWTYTYSVQLTRPDCHWHFFLGSWRNVIQFCRSSMATCVVVYKAKIVKSWRKICFRITVFRRDIHF